MAQDARILRALPPGPSSVLDPQLNEKTTNTEWMSGANHAHNGQSNHDQFPELPHNGALELSPNVLQALEEASTEDGQDNVVLGKRLRTLPGADPGVEEKLVTPEWLNENHGDYSQPWRGRLEDWSGEDTEDPLRMKRRREIWFKRFHHTLLKSPIVPLIFRLTVWVFSLTALALGASIQHMSREYAHPQGPSALMAIIVDAVALVYLVYITWDEYTSKPLGLRSPSAKARLVLLDIFFIVFDSANLSLAFESLSTVSGACTIGEVNQQVAPKNDAICDRQIALASVLLIALLAWLTTFAISVLRYSHLSLSFSTMRRTNCFEQTRRSCCTVILLSAF
ncbi:unnamed protein product [Aspergillus oryzae]|uniref:Unnamed protein product n=2 Tax=Aspergillus oryzae TaxID=5062 RepID=A0AAN5BWX2_ASPOZ|nr:unnamed protein product [Aspergillus oryzae]GMF85086.1 unnamed protein product [Aspergillus oryzae]GMG05322.1 unnamed protein product [Aspergillus oryzae]GMG28576.1 unnamed protein product [Aspergillus oryzae]GMG45717.1 unnamed protein product [Aspergillus oryzae var. brunneus]